MNSLPNKKTIQVDGKAAEYISLGNGSAVIVLVVIVSGGRPAVAHTRGGASGTRCKPTSVGAALAKRRAHYRAKERAVPAVLGARGSHRGRSQGVAIKAAMTGRNGVCPTCIS